MDETPLQKLLRLAGTARRTVPVRQYQRLERGRPQVVRQHVQGHAVGQHVAEAGDLKPGNVIRVGMARYMVTSVKPHQRKAAVARPNPAQGKGVNTGGPQSTGSKGKGVNTRGARSTASAGAGISAASDPQVILDAAVKAQKIPFNAPEVELGLQQAGGKGSRGVLVPRVLRVLVLQ